MSETAGAEPRGDSGRRLFFALWPEPLLQQRLHKLARAALAHASGRLVAQDNLHLTLVFLGRVENDRRPCLAAAADAAGRGPFDLTFDQAGYWRKPRVFWFGCSRQPAQLTGLVEVLRREALSCGCPSDTRPYAAHLTAARKVARDPGPLPIEPVEWTVARFVLVESRTYPEGVHYQVLKSWDL